MKTQKYEVIMAVLRVLAIVTAAVWALALASYFIGG